MPNLNNRYFNPYLVSLVLTVLAVYIFLPYVSKMPQKYFDISVDILINQDLNKTGELYLFWSLVFLSVIYTLIAKYINVKNLFFYYDPKDFYSSKEKNNPYKILLIVGLPLLSSWMLGFSPNISFVFAFVFTIFVLFFCANSISILLAGVFFYYSILAIVCLLGLRFNIQAPQSQLLVMISIVATTLLTYFCKNSTLIKCLPFIQLPIPLLLTYFLIYRYDLHGTVEWLSFSTKYRYFYYFLILTLFLISVGQIYKIIKSSYNLKLSQYILLSSVVSIFVFNSYTAPTLYFPLDMHHSGESFATWVQVKDFGKTLYDDYILPSGLFSIFNGFINEIMFDGGATNFNSLVAILKTSWCFITIALLYLIFGAEAALLISLFLSFSNYDRTYSLLVFILILAIPWLIKRSHFWLQVFITLSIIEFLYYPLYGFAFFIGGLPMGILQASNIKSRLHLNLNSSLVSACKSFNFNLNVILGWFATLTILVISFPLLIRIFKHASLYGSQTTVADGIAVFGRNSNYFMSYIPWEIIRTGLLYTAIFFIPLLAIVVLTDLLSTTVTSKIRIGGSPVNKSTISLFGKSFCCRWKGFLSTEFFCLSSSLLILIVTYQYSLQRLDFGFVTSRSGPVILILIGMLVPSVILKYSRNFGKNNIWKFIIIGLSLAIAYNFDTNYRAPLLTFVHKVPDDFVRVKEEDLEKLPKIGRGYIQKDNLLYLLTLHDQLLEYKNTDLKFTNLGYLQYYTLGLNNSATSTFYIAKTKETQQRIISIMQRDLPVIAPIDSFMSSYIYKWAIDEGYNSDKNGFLIPPKHKLQIQDEVRGECSKSFYFNQVGLYASSLGKSFKQLSPFLVEREYIRGLNTLSLPTRLDLYKPFLGADVDLLMLSLNSPTILNMKSQESLFVNNRAGARNKITIDFTVEIDGVSRQQSITAAYGDGILLFPMFANCYWHTGKITSLSIKASSTSSIDINIKDIKYFKWKKFDNLATTTN